MGDYNHILKAIAFGLLFVTLILFGVRYQEKRETEKARIVAMNQGFDRLAERARSAGTSELIRFFPLWRANFRSVHLYEAPPQQQEVLERKAHEAMEALLNRSIVQLGRYEFLEETEVLALARAVHSLINDEESIPVDPLLKYEATQVLDTVSVWATNKLSSLGGAEASLPELYKAVSIAHGLASITEGEASKSFSRVAYFLGQRRDRLEEQLAQVGEGSANPEAVIAGEGFGETERGPSIEDRKVFVERAMLTLGEEDIVSALEVQGNSGHILHVGTTRKAEDMVRIFITPAEFRSRLISLGFRILSVDARDTDMMIDMATGNILS